MSQQMAKVRGPLSGDQSQCIVLARQALSHRAISATNKFTFYKLNTLYLMENLNKSSTIKSHRIYILIISMYIFFSLLFFFLGQAMLCSPC